MSRAKKNYKIGEIVYATWFGGVIKMKVIGFHEPTNQILVQHLDAPGSFYQTPEQENKARRLWNKTKKGI